ncbi:MAG: magnesium/cobalt transporter CorA [Actinomycetota bacterium]
MKRLLVFDPKVGLVESPRIEEIPSYLKKGNTVWLDIVEPDQADYELAVDIFKVHALAIDEIKGGFTLPKIINFPKSSFVIWHSMDMTGKVLSRLYFVLSSNYLVTFHKGRVKELDSVFASCSHDPTLFERGTGMIIYTVLDNIVDNYFLLVDRLSDEQDALEDKMFGDPTPAEVRKLFSLKREMLTLRKIAAPEREVVNAILRRDLPYIRPETTAYYEDLYDHLVRIIDSVDTLRDMVSGAMEIYLATISNKLNIIMKTLTIIATIMMPLTVIVGIYGMNFRYMPELETRSGYFVVLGVMVLIAAGMLLWFWRRKWL